MYCAKKEGKKITPRTPEGVLKKSSHSCLCHVSKNVLLCGRILGILSVEPAQKKGHIRVCHFVTSKSCIAYSVVLQLVYFTYFCLVYGIRLSCNGDQSDESDWYLMTVGYFICDLDSLCTMFFGLIKSKKMAKILDNLSAMDNSITAMKKLQKHLNFIIIFFLICYLIVFSSYAFLSMTIREKLINKSVFSCYWLSDTLATVIRGFPIIFPTIQTTIVCLFALLIENQFEYLADSIAITTDNISQFYQRQHSGSQNVEISVQSIEKDENFQTLEQLTETHHKLFDILSDVNDCIGIPLLITNSSTLYAMIYYLYRFITESSKKQRRRIRSKIHYIISFLYRLIKLLTYMSLGKRMTTKSQLPLKTLQRARIIHLPSYCQQQVQTLIMQWNGKKGYLSASSVINIGPWLLAPIAGNVITYLLVALQFDDEDDPIKTGANITTLAKSSLL